MPRCRWELSWAVRLIRRWAQEPKMRWRGKNPASLPAVTILAARSLVSNFSGLATDEDIDHGKDIEQVNAPVPIEVAQVFLLLSRWLSSADQDVDQT